MYTGNTLSLTLHDNGVAELCFDNKNESVNKFDAATVGELTAALDALDSAAGVSGLLLSSAKPVFIVGADITEFVSLFDKPKDEFKLWGGANNGNINRIEALPYPTIAAINGFALGGGFELCLGADFRVMSSTAQVGLPEVNLGIIPGWGGTVRLPRLIGYDTAATWIATAAQQRPDAALAAGAVDAVVAPEALRDAALAMLQQAIDGKLDYANRRHAKTSPLQLNDIELGMSTTTVRAMVAGKAGRNYPAPIAAVDAMAKAARLDRDGALAIESETFYGLTQTPQARAMVGLFLADQYLGKAAKAQTKALKSGAKKVKSAAVIGAGIMGGGIAYQNAIKGYPALMKDINNAALDLGMSEASSLLAKRVDRGRMKPIVSLQTLSKIRPTLSYDGIEQVDIAVEAVVELEKVKKVVLAELESKMADDAVITSNTSTISITNLATALQRPENFAGMHFFNPVHAMPLVEVIRGEHTSDATVASVVDYALGLGKKPVVVNDCPGFLVNRVLFAYMFGFEMLLREGADFRQIDKVMEKWGWPMGPGYLMDVVGIDTLAHCYDVMIDGLSERFIKPDSDAAAVMMYNAGRLGQKSGQGFYKYELDKRGRRVKVVDDVAIEMLAGAFGPAKQFDEQEIVDRLMVAMATELVHCLDEGIVASPAEADMAFIYGVGFPAFRGGLCRWMDEVGLAEICARGDKYASLSPLYAPTDSMRKKAAAGGSWY